VVLNTFDERAATWDDDPAKLDRAKVVADAISDAIVLDGTQRALEYGAGTGLVTQALRSAIGPVTLVDTSQGMRDVMLAKIAAGTITDARVWDLDLEKAPAPDERFDLVVTVLTLHHVHDVGVVLSKFAELLAGGGRLCVADLDKEDGSFHGPGFDGHHGFDRAELAAQLAAAGFTDVEFRQCGQISRDGATYPMFLATCRVAAH
jgi:ubiquinone/menaquinone biosynthesis C-methylase UbiE